MDMNMAKSVSTGYSGITGTYSSYNVNADATTTTFDTSMPKSIFDRNDGDDVYDSLNRFNEKHQFSPNGATPEQIAKMNAVKTKQVNELNKEMRTNDWAQKLKEQFGDSQDIEYKLTT